MKSIFWFFCAQAFGVSVPFTVVKAPISPLVVLSGQIEPKNSATVKIRWYSLLKKIAIDRNQEIRQGDLLAEVSLEYLDYRKKYFEGRLTFLRRALVDAISEEKIILEERKKLKTLASKGIVPESSVEKTEIRVVDGALKRMRAERDVRELVRQLDETMGQIKQANYFAPISGVVTEVLVNPKQVSGVVIAMPDAKLCRIDQPGRYIVSSVAMDAQVVHLVPGMKGYVVFEESGEKTTAEITEINQNAASLKNGGGLFDVRLEFERPGPILPRGYQVRVEIEIDKSVKPTIPWNAVRTNSSGYTVLKYIKDQGWNEVPVELGARSRHRVEVKLEPGEIVDAQLW